MQMAGILETIALAAGTAAVVGIAWKLLRKVVPSDARPGLAPLSCFGDFPAVPSELIGRVAATRKVTGGGGETASSSGHCGGSHFHRETGATA